MRFISPHAAYKLIIVPTDYELVRGGQRRTLHGIRVEFSSGVYDTEEAARLNHWSADEKELVEKALLQNADFGRRGGYYLVEGNIEDIGPERPDVDLDEEGVLAELDTICAVTFQTPEGAVPCGNKAVGGTDYCKSHQRIAEKARS